MAELKTYQELWYDMDNGQHYILKEGTGEKIKCDSQGNPTKNFLLYKTGHISYQDRVKVANQSQNKGIMAELPKSIRQQSTTGYIASMDKIDGYTQFPRPAATAYFNQKENYKRQMKKIPKVEKGEKLLSDFNATRIRETEKAVGSQTCTFFNKKGIGALRGNTLPLSLPGSQRVSKASLGGEKHRGITPDLGKTEGGIKYIKESTPFNATVGKGGVICKSTHLFLNNSTLNRKQFDSIRPFLNTGKGIIHGNAIQDENKEKTYLDTFIPEKDLEGEHWDDSNPINAYRIKDTLFINKAIQIEKAQSAGYVDGAEKAQKIKTKGQFKTGVNNPRGLYMLDMEWKGKANPLAAHEQTKREELDKYLFEKRRKQRVLKNMAQESMLRGKEATKQKEAKKAEKIARRNAKEELMNVIKEREQEKVRVKALLPD